MSDMVERVARTIARNHYDRALTGERHYIGNCTKEEHVAYMVEHYWKDFSKAARDVIAEIREPSEAMCKAGYENADHSIEGVGDLAPPPDEQPRLIWQAMTDEALK